MGILLPGFCPEVPGLAMSGPLPAVDTEHKAQAPCQEETDVRGELAAPDGREAVSAGTGGRQEGRDPGTRPQELA